MWFIDYEMIRYLRAAPCVELGLVLLVIDAGSHVSRGVGFPELGFPGLSRYVDGHFVVIFKTVYSIIILIKISRNEFFQIFKI